MLTLFSFLSYILSYFWFHMGSYSVTCYPTQVNTACLIPSQTGWYSIFLSCRDGRLSWRRWGVTYWDGLLTYRPSQIQILTWRQNKTELFIGRDHCGFDKGSEQEMRCMCYMSQTFFIYQQWFCQILLKCQIWWRHRPSVDEWVGRRVGIGSCIRGTGETQPAWWEDISIASSATPAQFL